MARVIYEFPSDGGVVRVEAEEPRAQGPQEVSRGGRIVEKASESFESALAGLRPIAEAIVAQTAGLSSAPKTIEATFGIKLSGELGVLLASSKAEAHVAIKLTWQRQAEV